MPSKRVRTKLQKRRDLKLVSAYYLQGMTQAEIALKIDRDQSTVSRDLREIQKSWQESTLVDFDQKKREELAKIDALELTYWQAWRDSGGEIITKTVERIASEKGDDGAKRAREVVKTEFAVGEFAALRGVQWCIEKRIEIFGLAAPKKIAPTDPSGTREYADQEYNRAISTLFDALREEIFSEGGESSSDLDSPERETMESAIIEG